MERFYNEDVRFAFTLFMSLFFLLTISFFYNLIADFLFSTLSAVKKKVLKVFYKFSNGERPIDTSGRKEPVLVPVPAPVLGERPLSSPDEKLRPSTNSIPKKGQDPEWDAFLKAVLTALGITLGQVTGALLFEIGNLYCKLKAGGDPFTLWALFRAAIEAGLGVLPLSMPFFLFVAVIAFVYKMIANDVVEKRLANELEKKMLEDQKRVLEKLEKLVNDNEKISIGGRIEILKKDVKKWLRSLVAGVEKNK